MEIKSEIVSEEQEILGILSRFKKRDFSGNSGQAIKNSSFQIATTLVAKLGSLVFIIILARLLLPELFGLYGLALSTIVLFSSFADFGISSAIITFIGKSEGKGTHSKSRAYFYQLLKWKSFLVLLCSLVLLLTAYFVSNNIYNKPIFLALMAGAIYLPAMTFLSFFENNFRALNNFKYSLIKEGVFQGLRLILVPLSVLFVISREFSPDKILFAIFLSLAICYLIPLLLLMILTKKHLVFLKAPRSKLNILERKGLVLFLLPLSVTLLAGLFFGQIDVVMLGHFVESSFIGFYQAAFSLVGAVSAIIGFASLAVFPIFSRLKGKRLEKGLNKTLRITFLISLIAAGFTYFIAPLIIRIIYGVEYLPAASLLRIFSILVVILPLSGIYGAYFISTKQTKTYAKIIVTSTIINIILNYTFIVYLLRYSMFHVAIGVCVATVISKFIYMGGMIVFRKR